MIVTGEFAVDERGVPGRYGRISGGESESTTSIRYCGERFSRAAPGKKAGDPDLVKEVIPRGNVQNIRPFGYAWSTEPWVSVVAGDQRFV